ncbi:MAG TPA: LamG-like jellyroll fold domain-containing protein [Solirubrobacterales bacterium]|nr:LamG-like jellyroll fold domain-containing protein [Solirubrobacterales bacterium]
MLALIVLLSASDAHAASSPIASYAFNEGSGEVAGDTAANHDAAVDGASWVEGKYGKALSFNGESSCVSVPNSVDLQLAGSFTLEAWVKPSNATQWAPVFFKEAETFYSYSLFFGAFEAGHVQGYVADEPWEWSEVESPEKLVANTWSHIALTSDGTTLRLYVNGKLVDTSSAKSAMESSGPLQIGCSKTFGEYYQGLIDEVRIYDRSLSGAEVEEDKATAIETSVPDAPTAAYGFDESGSATVQDSVGSHDGKITSPDPFWELWTDGKYGHSLAFNGEDTCVEIPNSVDLQLSQAFTVEAWVNPDHAQEFAPVFFKEAESFYSYSLYLGAFESGHLEGFLADEPWEWSEVQSPEVMPAKTWTHVAMTSDGIHLRLYVNGKLVDSGSARAAMESNGPLQIGCAKTADHSFNEYFDGKIDEVRIYNRSLSAAELATDAATSVVTHAPAGAKLTSPSDGTRSARRFKLAASWTNTGVKGVIFQYLYPGKGWINLPAAKVTNAKGEAVKWPVAVKAGAQKSEPLYWDAPDEEKFPATVVGFQMRAVLTAATGGGGFTDPAEVVLNRNLGGPKDAVANVGPGSVDLLTGNLSVGRTDAAISGFSALEFARSFNSREPKAEEKGPLGPGWIPGAPVESAGESAWVSVKEVEETEFFEEENEEGEIETVPYTYRYALVTGLEGVEVPFEIDGSGNYVTPPDLTGWSLVRLNGNEVALTESGGTRTVFYNGGAGSEYLPKSVTEIGSGNSTSMVYEFKGSKRLLTMILAPAPKVSCNSSNATTTPGCRSLVLNYETKAEWGGEQRLASIKYYAGTSSTTMGNWEVAKYEYNGAGRLVAEWDPRISPALKETYSYDTDGRLQTITPPGQEPWTMEYGTAASDFSGKRLLRVKRASLLASPNNVAQTTIAYGVPVSGEGAPYDMSPATVGKWGQEDAPFDAVAIFPPDQIPSSPPSSYSHATVYYLDAEGYGVNVASPSGAGTSAPSITTSETDEFGNVTRELSAQNRLRALAAESTSVAKSHELETKRSFSADGTQMEEEWGPMHQVRISEGAEAGTTKQARFHRVVNYDEGAPAPPAGYPMPHAPTKETTNAQDAKGNLFDQRVSETHYNWTLRKPTETIVDPSGLNIRTVTVYDSATGLPVESRQPSSSGAKSAGTTKTIYYTPVPATEKDCEGSSFAIYAGLPCKVLPGAQASGSGRPELLVRTFKSYDVFGGPLEVLESPKGGTTNVRKTVSTYDTAGRPLTQKIEGAGTEPPKTEMLYSSTTGLPTTQRFKCETSCTGFDDQATTTTYDALGRVTKYEDADGGKAETTYDLDGRPVAVSDNKGSQTMSYDTTSGLPVKLEDSAAGTFTAAYDADGNMTERALPNGLTAKTTYNEAGESTHLTYTKASSCGTSCTWFDEGIERSIYGQDLSQTGTLASYLYTYDKAGRLEKAAETPTGGGCMTRSYSFDPDSNRLSLTPRSPGVGGVCNWSGGTTQTYKYDAADRLEGPTYDSWGRITSLPAEFAGGKALTTKYFSTDMVAEQVQNGVTNTFQLDGALRQRQRVQAGGIEGVEVFHYDGGSDTPAWTQLGSTWTRSITGIGGELCGVQESSSGTTLRVTNLHGDVVAKASLIPAETKLLVTYRFDEFGNPVGGTAAGRFGWFGGKQRRTELASGVIQMGARSYVPAIGRFLSLDPIPGGSASVYDYANADPVNGLDLGGTARRKAATYRASRQAAARRRIELPSFPSFAGPCAFFVHAVDRSLGGVHTVSAGVTPSCGGLIVSVKISFKVKTKEQYGNPPATYNGIRSGVPMTYVGFYLAADGNFRPVQFCFKVAWHEEGDKKQARTCTPMASAFPV